MGADYIITGVESALGRQIAERLSARDCRVVGIDCGALAPWSGPDIRLYSAGACDADALDDIFRAEAREYTVVIHAAERISLSDEPDDAMQTVNCGGTQIILQLCARRPIRRLVYVGSALAVAPGRRLPFVREPEEFDPSAVSGQYGKSKAAACAAVMRAAAEGMDCVVALPGMLVGPGDPSAAEPGNRLVRALAAGQMRFCVRGGVDMVDIRDAAQGVVLAADKGIAGHSYILSGRYVRLRELYDQVHALCGTPRRITLPLALARSLVAPMRAWDGERPLFTAQALDILAAGARLSHSRAGRELGYRTNSVAAAVADAVRQYAPPQQERALALPERAAQA